MKTFNLSKFEKNASANGESAKGMIQSQTRAFMNCYKSKLDKGAKSAWEAWKSCSEEYNDAAKSDWASKYS